MKRYAIVANDFHDGRVVVTPDGEWIRYKDHCEAMKRIAGAPIADEREALIAARPYVVGAYECAFPDDERNAEVLAMIDAALAPRQMVADRSAIYDAMVQFCDGNGVGIEPEVVDELAGAVERFLQARANDAAEGMVADSAGGAEPVHLDGRICEHCGEGNAVLTFEDGQFASNCDQCCADCDYFMVERLNQLIAAPAPSASPAALTAGSREKLIELANELDGELNSGANWTKAQHTCCSVSGELRALAAQPPAAAEAEQDADDTPGEILAGRLIDAWCQENGGQIPWDKAIEITAITTKMPDVERLRLLSLDDDGAPVPADRRTADLAAFVRHLAYQLRKAAPDNDLANRAVDYLKREGLQGSPMRLAAELERPTQAPENGE